MEESTLPDLVESLLARTAGHERLLTEEALDAAAEAGGEILLRDRRFRTLHSKLFRLAEDGGGVATYRVIGKYTAFLLVLAVRVGGVTATLLNARSGAGLAHAELLRGRKDGKVDYALALSGTADTTPFGVRLLDALFLLAIHEGITTLESMASGLE